MSAIKQQQSAQPYDYSARTINEALTQQERRALSLIWRDDDSDLVNTKRRETAVEYCAELGYN